MTNSGLNAAKKLCANERIDAEIDVIQPESYPESLIAMWKVALAPYAVAAKMWSDARVVFNNVTEGEGLRKAVDLPRPVTAVLAEAASKATVAALESWKTLRSLYSLK